MDEQPTTDAPADVPGADDPIIPDESAALPEGTQADSSADSTANEQKEEKGGEEPVPGIDPKLASFAKGQGIEDVSDLSPRELSLLKSAYDNKAEQDRHRQKASELEKSLIATPAETQGDPELAARVQRIEMAQNVQAFFADHPEAKNLEEKMAGIVMGRPEIGQMVNSGYLTVSDLYNLARGSDSNRDAQLKADGGREALKKVASKQQAKAVPGVATTSEFSKDEPEDAFLKAFNAN